MSSSTRKLDPDIPTITTDDCNLMSLSHDRSYAGDAPSRLEHLNELLKLGITTWDDADIYSDTEEVFGKRSLESLRHSTGPVLHSPG